MSMCEGKFVSRSMEQSALQRRDEHYLHAIFIDHFLPGMRDAGSSH